VGKCKYFIPEDSEHLSGCEKTNDGEFIAVCPCNGNSEDEKCYDKGE